ncbi:TTL-domain-containing protein [Lentinula raphanica]|uniref:TTL-domain-containing protein n=1 Tax=Lentinula raphanica TaxID=153919 RepID=A0AA38PJG7_9AGAR|nr:TTL-domain-containing protein [Lentinula raphanica]
MLGVICIWPSAPFTHSLVHKALQSLETPVHILASASDASSNSPALLLQWSSYDEIQHELSINQSILQSSYIIRKCLIRKHFLSRSIFSYLTKHPKSALELAWPRTYEMEISFADELDELFADELWELGEELGTSERWWILKPGMADRGNGIRLFNDRQTLEHIFDEFEEKEEETEDEQESNTTVITSQLRHFVIQEYILHPLLFDPREVPIGPDSSKPSVLEGYKFHLRAYCLASGALTLYLYNRVLALFSSLPYTVPNASDSSTSTQVDLAPHLTNTSLQTHRGEEGVRLLNELVGCRILSEGFEDHPVLTEDDVEDVLSQIGIILSETFKAALENPVHFQAIPNAFELFGVDFLIDSSKSRFQIKLLEINAEPAIELTGPRLAWILEDLFVDIGKVCVEPFLTKQQASSVGDEDGWNVGETRGNLRKCLEVEVRRL